MSVTAIRLLSDEQLDHLEQKAREFVEQLEGRGLTTVPEVRSCVYPAECLLTAIHAEQKVRDLKQSIPETNNDAS